jgi:hypothetical protein
MAPTGPNIAHFRPSAEKRITESKRVVKEYVDALHKYDKKFSITDSQTVKKFDLFWYPHLPALWTAAMHPFYSFLHHWLYLMD